MASEISRKEFMQKVGISFSGILLMNCISSCSESEIPDPNPTPDAKVNFSIDLDDSKYSDLNDNGGYLVIKSNIDRNVIVARDLNGTLLAVDGNCPHANGLIIFQANENNFKCSLTGAEHGTTFQTDGEVIGGGSAKTALRKYTITINVNDNSISIIE